MLKKTIQYEDLDGNTVKDDFYFHFSQAELAKLQLKYEALGGMEAHFKKIMADKDVDGLTDAFEHIILGSIGERGADGKRFEKRNGEVAAHFKETDAYSVLFMELVSGGGEAFQEFLQGALPSGLQEKLTANVDLQNRVAIATERIQNGDEGLREHLRDRVETIHAEQLSAARDGVPPFIREKRPPTREELLALTPEQMQKYFSKE